MTARTGSAKQGRLRFRLIRETIGELRKVVWLTRREALYLTALVILVSAIAGAALGAFDFGFTKLIDSVFLGGR